MYTTALLSLAEAKKVGALLLRMRRESAVVEYASQDKGWGKAMASGPLGEASRAHHRILKERQWLVWCLRANSKNKPSVLCTL